MTSARVRCRKCKKLKVESKFSNDSSRPSGKFPWCMECQATSTSKFQDEEAELNGHVCPMDDVPIRGHANRRFCSIPCKDKVKALKSKFNLTPAQYRALVEATNGICPLCKKRPTQWHVEHNHKTREVYGVVCAACNVGALAFTYHDVEFARRVVEYLANPPAFSVLDEVVIVPEAATQPSKIHTVWQKAGGRKIQ